jgi:hypothetical protein
MATRRKDIYDKEVERLTENPKLIHDAWMFGEDHSPLFDCVCKSRGMNDETFGCLTQIRNHKRGVVDIFFPTVAETEELTKEIRKDRRIPKDAEDIRPKHLPIFAEWQRKLDKTLKGRKRPRLPVSLKKVAKA